MNPTQTEHKTDHPTQKPGVKQRLVTFWVDNAVGDLLYRIGFWFEYVLVCLARKVKAVDTTGAGDTYCGSICVALSEGKSLKEAAEFASAVSALSVTKMGAQTAIPTRAEAEAFIAQ